MSIIQLNLAQYKVSEIIILSPPLVIHAAFSYSLSLITFVPRIIDQSVLPPFIIIQLMDEDTFHSDREWSYLSATFSGKSYNDKYLLCM